MHKPFFSVIIPTYNRSSLLKAGIMSVLDQKYKDFELIILDDCSPDDTQKMVKSFRDSRIKYFRNKKNLGMDLNQKKVISLASGEYIFTVGDDDFILWEDTLSYVKKIIDQNHYGFIRLNLIEKKFVGKGLRKSIIKLNEDLICPKETPPDAVLDFFQKTAVGHWAGLVIKNKKDIYKNILDDSKETEWVKILYEATKKDGAQFLGKYYMIITWSQSAILHHYDVPPHNRLMVENYLKYVSTIMSKNDYDKFQDRFTKVFIKLQPVAKLYSNNYNLLKFDKRLLEINPSIRFSPVFYISLFLALVMPKSFWRFIRVLQHRQKNYLPAVNNLGKVLNRYRVVEKHYFLNES